MPDVESDGKTSSDRDDIGTYDPVEFDPEQTAMDDELVDGDTLALRDAVRDIVACDGRFEILMY
jgi:hypothetical protein